MESSDQDILALRDPRRLREVTIELRAIALRTRPGELIGRETELRLRLGCHQNLLRQVARRLEAQGLITIKRGVAGGYFASRPVEGMVIDAAALYLVGEGMTLGDALLATRGMVIDAARIAADRVGSESRRAIIELASELAAKIPEDTDAATFLADEERIDRIIFDVVDIPALRLFVNMLNRFSLADFGESMFTRQPDRRALYRQERLRTLRSIADGDGVAAGLSMQIVNDMIEGWISVDDLNRRIGLDMVFDQDG